MRDRDRTYRAWWARVACRPASSFEPVAAAGPCSRTGRPTAGSRKTPCGWRRRTATYRRRTSRPRSAPRTVFARLSNTTCRAKAETQQTFKHHRARTAPWKWRTYYFLMIVVTAPRGLRNDNSRRKTEFVRPGNAMLVTVRVVAVSDYCCCITTPRGRRYHYGVIDNSEYVMLTDTFEYNEASPL